MKSICFLTIVVAVLSLNSCQKNQASKEQSLKNNTQWTFSSGTICGWCAANDTLEISTSHSTLVARRDCQSTVVDTMAKTQQQQYQNLLSHLHEQQFKAINLNTCNVCADGCDFWVTIQNGLSSHTIRFGPQDSAQVATVLPLLNELKKIQADLGYPPLF